MEKSDPTLKIYSIHFKIEALPSSQMLDIQTFIDFIRKNSIIVFSKHDTNESITLDSEMSYWGSLANGAQA